jgi:hypothetical protein
MHEMAAARHADRRRARAGSGRKRKRVSTQQGARAGAGSSEHGRLKKKQWCVRTTYVRAWAAGCVWSPSWSHIMHACRSIEEESNGWMSRDIDLCVFLSSGARFGPRPELRGREYMLPCFTSFLLKNFFEESNRPWPGLLLRTVF